MPKTAHGLSCNIHDGPVCCSYMPPAHLPACMVPSLTVRLSTAHVICVTKCCYRFLVRRKTTCSRNCRWCSAVGTADSIPALECIICVHVWRCNKHWHKCDVVPCLCLRQELQKSSKVGLVITVELPSFPHAVLYNQTNVGPRHAGAIEDPSSPSASLLPLYDPEVSPPPPPLHPCCPCMTPRSGPFLPLCNPVAPVRP